MSKVKSYDKNSHPSVYDAIYEIIDKHLLVATDTPIYSARALDEVCFFLAENNIKHQYTIIPAPAGADCDQIISLMWVDGKSYGNEVWYSRGKIGPNTFRVNLIIQAENQEAVEDWIVTMDEMDIKDWSVEEI